MKAMAAAVPAGPDAEDARVDNVVTMQQDDPVNRPNKFDVTIAPAHPTRNGHGEQRLVENVGKKLGGRQAGLERLEAQPLALVSRRTIE